jgi:hypothetical protein
MLMEGPLPVEAGEETQGREMVYQQPFQAAHFSVRVPVYIRALTGVEGQRRMVLKQASARPGVL